MVKGVEWVTNMKGAIRTKTPNIIRKCKDPHHHGINEWCIDGENFWIRNEMGSKWTLSKKSHITPARAKMFYWLVTGLGVDE